MKLCPHVTLKIDKQSKPPVVTVTRGAVFAYFAWSRKLQADTPRLRCAECHEFVQIRRFIVKRDVTATINPRVEQPHGKTTARKQARKSNKRQAEDDISFVFMD